MELKKSEIEVFELLKQGLTHEQVGEKLGIAKKTVDSRVYEAYKRFGVHTLIEFLVKIGDITNGKHND